MRKIIIIVLILSGVFFEYLRDYIFVNINLQLHFLHFDSIGHKMDNYTDSRIYFFIHSLSSTLLYKIKWFLSLIFITIFYVIGNLLSKQIWSNNDYKKFRKIYLMGGLSITILAAVFYIIHIYYGQKNNSNFYLISIELSHFVQSILYPITFITAFYSHNRIVYKS